MPPTKRSKIPNCSRASPAKSLDFLSRIPRPTTVESPANRFLISCVSRWNLAHCASTSSLSQNPGSVLPSCVAAWNLRPLTVAFPGVLLGFASFSSSSNGFSASNSQGFSDTGASISSQLVRCVPSVESLSFAKAAVRNFLELDVAQARSTFFMAKVEDFHHKRRRDEVMEQENSSVRAKIKNITVEYDANEDEVKRLEEKILEHRAKMASLMDEAESLEKGLLSNRRDTQVVVDEVVSLKEDYGKWVREIQDSDDKQGECLFKWEQLRRLFC
ncbi:hypothetical protein F511_35087 [Dorcoceras hygrometricum]|uniref:Uncharacterized protein n=1 Tax=Dorcoceras hygrometricum TaxID=472368 RepID=A0A2Z7AQB4_9LAMI|nr:hypothetical protein F511_35087 [Dorcoceras hygrometricum]